jgi:hypothetical protein
MSNANDLSGSGKLFVATRTDGFGGRLTALVNAIFLAQETGWRFGFTWNEEEVDDKDFHSVDIASAVFDSAFLEKHYLGEALDPAGFVALESESFSIAELKAQSDDGLQGWICNSFSLVQRMAAQESVKIHGTAHAFRSIGFAKPLREAVREAEGLALPGRTAAIHLRSGDIVHGRFRRRPYFNKKVIPSPLAKSMIRDLQQQGAAVILFGEHRETLDYLKSETGCHLLDEFGPPSPDMKMARVLFEMMVMSRCAEIYAGESMFAVLASIIGSTSVRSPREFYGREKLRDALLAELEQNASAYHPREAAYGYQFAFAMSSNSAAWNRQERLLDKAHELDPENDFYSMKKAVLRFEEGRYEDGETILSRLYHADDIYSARAADNAIRFVAARNMHGTFDWQDDFPLFKAAALAGMPHAAACCALFMTAYGDMKSALAMIQRALAAQPGNLLFQRIETFVTRAGRSSKRPTPLRRKRRHRIRTLLRRASARLHGLLGISAR